VGAAGDARGIEGKEEGERLGKVHGVVEGDETGLVTAVSEWRKTEWMGLTTPSGRFYS
jgi:hypothetical protein